MKILRKKQVYGGKYVRVLESSFLAKDRKKGKWEFIERKDAVAVFALTKEKEVILEKIYRIPLKSYVIEFPAGILDKKGESKKEAAKRELLEETGYLAKNLIFVKALPFNPSLEKTKINLFFAPDVEFFGKKKTKDLEEIEVIKIPLKNLLSFLFNPPKNLEVDLMDFSFILLLAKKGLI